MLSKKNFVDTVEAYLKFSRGLDRIEEAIAGNSFSVGLWNCDWVIAACCMFDRYLESHFSEDGCNIIYDYLFEDKREMKVGDELVEIDDLDDLYMKLIEGEYGS